MQWVTKVSEVSNLFNPLSIIKWNIDKHYLKDLESLGVPIAPSVFVEKGEKANIESIMPLAIELGAHIRVGLEDAPFGCQQSNLELVEQATETILNSGRSLATVDEIRQYR